MSLSASSSASLSLYRSLLRYCRGIRYSDRDSVLRRIRTEFDRNRFLKDPADVQIAQEKARAFLERARVKSRVPKLDPADVIESIARGGGPGGQSVNKSWNAVRLKHVPTGIHVFCHDSRSLEKNRTLAWKKLLTHIDNHINGELSVEAQKRRIEAEEKRLYKEEKARIREEKKRQKELEKQTKEGLINQEQVIPREEPQPEEDPRSVESSAECPTAEHPLTDQTKKID